MRVDPAHFRPSAPRGFLVVDGVNGAGKGTLINAISKHLQMLGISPLLTREPGGTELGRTVRELILGRPVSTRAPLTELFLFAADRAQHVSEVIKPALARGVRVISDRYLYSTVAFQGYGRGLGAELTLDVNRIAVDGCLPDAVLLLDLDPAEGLRRTAARGAGGSRGANAGRDSFEEEELAFHHRLRAGFLDLAERLPEPFIVLDASRSPQAVFDEIAPFLKAWALSPPPVIGAV